MSHQIELNATTGLAEIAYVRANVGQLSSRNRAFHKADGRPWHGLGQEILPTDDIATIRTKAGLDFEVLRTPVQYTVPRIIAGINIGETREVASRDVLFRSDTGASLGVVSRKGYKVHQPREILDLFGEIVSLTGITIEVVGALDGGKRVWALARVGDEANILHRDTVRSYILLATSYDGSLATIGQYTAQRVVCHNTISLALADTGARRVTLPHRSAWNPARIRDELGLVHQAFDQFVTDAKRLASAPLTDQQAGEITAKLIGKHASSGKAGVVDVTKSRGYQRVLQLFNGAAIGSELTQGKTAWQLLNAVTQYVDHERGRNRDTGLNAAWFGAGDALKSDAKDALLDLIA